MGGIVDEATDSAALADSAPVYGHNTAMPDIPVRTHVQRAHGKYVRLEIRTDALYSLIHDKALVIEDLRGLDRQAKIWLRKRLLDTLLL